MNSEEKVYEQGLMIHGWLILTEALSWEAHIDDRGDRFIHREREFLQSKGFVPKL